jgi:5-methylcytosine-specific restriction endonuclease McrA
MIKRTTHDYNQIKKYKCNSKAKYSNARFDDKICGGDVYEVLKKYNFKCFYCGKSIKPTSWQLDHFYPKASGGKNIPENIVCSCKWCNQMKNALDGFAFLQKCKYVIENNFLSLNNIPFYETPKPSGYFL